MARRTEPLIVDPDETPQRILAKSVVDISTGVQKLLNGPLSRKAIVLLIHESIPVKDRPGRREVEVVLEAAATFGRKWVKSPGKASDAKVAQQLRRK